MFEHSSKSSLPRVPDNPQSETQQHVHEHPMYRFNSVLSSIVNIKRGLFIYDTIRYDTMPLSVIINIHVHQIP